MLAVTRPRDGRAGSQHIDQKRWKPLGIGAAGVGDRTGFSGLIGDGRLGGRRTSADTKPDHKQAASRRRMNAVPRWPQRFRLTNNRHCPCPVSCLGTNATACLRPPGFDTGQPGGMAPGQLARRDRIVTKVVQVKRPSGC